MNRYTDERINKMNCSEVIKQSFEIAGYGGQKKLKKKLQKAYDQIMENNEHDWLAMLKYTIRFFMEKSKATDPLESINYWQFENSFYYSPEEGGYVPSFKKTKKTRLISEYYDSIESKQIEACWNKIKNSLKNSNDKAPIQLGYSYDSHVYFMKNKKTDEIKIGISIHPEIRRRQIQFKEKAPIEILHIIGSGGRELENELHVKFSEYSTRGEWFANNQMIQQYIEESAEG